MNPQTHTLSDEFVLPTNKGVHATRQLDQAADDPCIYLVGNSLGALSKRSETLVKEELGVWASTGVEGHFAHPLGREWTTIQDQCTPILAKIVGAKEPEVACMGTLTTNLHLMMTTFYKPTSERFKILCEAKAFPSDQYVFASHSNLHGRDPAEAVIELSPRAGEYFLRSEDILAVIAEQGPSIALVILSGVQYYTGQWFPMQAITRATKAAGAICGWDLAHAVGNVPLSLHDWDVDFAVWCTYKYLNSGPGGIAGLYIHEKWDAQQTPNAGWWGQEVGKRFEMGPTFRPIKGAQGYQQSNPCILAIAALLGSLQIFEKAGLMPAVRARSLELTGYLEGLLIKLPLFVPLAEANARTTPGFTIITGSDPEARGAQLSMLFLPIGSEMMRQVSKGLTSFGVIADTREPDVIRFAPTPMYNSLRDCERAVGYLDEVLRSIKL
ncbi:kynureninase [Athelia psychrophila]|uniref:Kynureninase n=1 Tax=Athelia psychrophila TaxID=1759441 RepID=A0A166N9J9_9AGAM|nr:kynureninase [Fibularhizoctonia sp. CBS 109695]